MNEEKFNTDTPLDNEIQDIQTDNLIDKNTQNPSNDIIDDIENELIEEIPSDNLMQGTVLVNDTEVNYYVETLKELKTTNFLLQLILVTITVLYIINKIYSFARSCLTVKL